MPARKMVPLFIANSASTFRRIGRYPPTKHRCPCQSHLFCCSLSRRFSLCRSIRAKNESRPFAERNRFAKPPACCLSPRTVAAPSAMSKTCVWSGLERANLFVLYNKDGLSLGCSFMMRGVSSKLSAPVSPSYTIRALDTVGMRTEIPVCISSFSWSRSLCSLITSRQLPPFSPAQSHTRRRSRVRE